VPLDVQSDLLHGQHFRGRYGGELSLAHSSCGLLHTFQSHGSLYVSASIYPCRRLHNPFLAMEWLTATRYCPSVVDR
jgi:hypothetical protein